jgi:hypothetical protein
MFAYRGCHAVTVTDPYGRILYFLDRSRYFFLSSISSVVLTTLSGPRSRPTTFFWYCRESNPGLRICSQELWELDHRGGRESLYNKLKKNVINLIFLTISVNVLFGSPMLNGYNQNFKHIFCEIRMMYIHVRVLSLSRLVWVRCWCWWCISFEMEE